MKKIPILFEREYENHKVVGIKPIVTPGMEWVLRGEGVATLKVDGACCAIINGELYKRYDAKKGKKAPEGAIPCCEADPITGHHPHWVKCVRENPADKWFFAAYDFEVGQDSYLGDATYEAIGKHFQGNPYGLDHDRFFRHGSVTLKIENRSFESIREYLKENEIEGIVFWRDGEPMCKIKRSDFGFEWPTKDCWLC